MIQSIGTATTNAQAGTWPTETLQISSAQSFNRVVVHYDAPPVTRGDYGVIFMADNMRVSPAPPPVLLREAVRLPNGAFQFSFTNNPSLSFTVLASTNVALSITSWSALGAPTETSSGQYQFIDQDAATIPLRFYCVH